MSTLQVTSTLFQLQQLDLELDRVAAEKQSVTQALQENFPLRKARTAYKDAQQQVLMGEQAQKDAEWSLEDIARRLSTQEQRLYSGNGVNSKDLNSLQQEVQRLRAQHHHQEEVVLEVMDSMETLQEGVQHRLRELQQAEAVWQGESATLVTRREQLEIRQQEVQAKRSHLAETIPADLLQRYNGMRRTKQGRAISKIEQGSCQWCRVILTPSELQQVRVSPDLQTCTNCGRILYYER